MISNFLVGATFKIVNEASPTLRKILAEVRELNVALDRARASLTSLGKFAMPAGLTTAVGETAALATAWGDVAKNATAAQRAIGSASATAARTLVPAALRLQRAAVAVDPMAHVKDAVPNCRSQDRRDDIFGSPARKAMAMNRPGTCRDRHPCAQ